VQGAEFLQVAPRQNLLFLHIPKTAGMSLRSFLATQYRPADIHPAASWNDYAASGLDAENYRLFSGHFRFNFTEIVPPGTRSVTILRDPVARYISALRHSRRDPNFEPAQAELRLLPIAEFIRHPILMMSQRDAQTSWLAASAPAPKVARYLAENPNGNIWACETICTPDERLARAKQNLEAIDFIGFVEDLARSTDELCRHMRFHPLPALPVVNVAPGGDPEFADMTPDDFAVIRGQTERDAELYAYARQLSDRQRRRRSIVDLGVNGLYRVPPTLPFRIKLDEPMPGSGWHPAETQGTSLWRWTDGSVPMTLDLPIKLPPRTACQITIHRDASAAYMARGMTITVDGTTRPVTLTDDHHLTTIAFSLGRDLEPPRWPCEIQIDVADRTPLRGPGADLRFLGLFVVEIAIIAPPTQTEPLSQAIPAPNP
jgi:hypothetical protein